LNRHMRRKPLRVGHQRHHAPEASVHHHKFGVVQVAPPLRGVAGGIGPAEMHKGKVARLRLHGCEKSSRKRLGCSFMTENI